MARLKETAGDAPDYDRKIAGIELQETVGVSPEAYVFRGVKRGEELAVKLITEETVEEAEATAARLEREAAFYGSIDQAGVPDCREVGRDGRVAYLALKYVPGSTLAELLDHESALQTDRAIEFARQLVETLIPLHRRSLVHRDIKPSNVMVSDGALYLIDFGLAGEIETEGVDDKAIGTFRYGAPEQSGMTSNPINRQTDLYSVGVILFEMLTGRAPFEAEDVGDLIHQHAAVDPPRVEEDRPDIPAIVGDVVETLMAKDPDDRFQSAEGTRRVLERLQSWLDAGASPGDAPQLSQLRKLDETVTRWSDDHPLIGRARELDVLQEHCETAFRERTARMVCVEGLPGSGKSRLVKEFVSDLLKREDVPILTGKSDLADPIPGYALRRAFEAYLTDLEARDSRRSREGRRRLREAAGGKEAALCALVDSFSALFDDVPKFEVGGNARQRLYDQTARFVEELADAHGGLVLWLDDIQWLDEGSRDVLKRLTKRESEAPLFIIATSRNDPESMQRLEEFVDTFGDSISERFTVEGFDEDEVEALLEYEFGTIPFDDTFVSKMARQSGGNPLFVWQYLRAIRQAGAILPHWNDWKIVEPKIERLELGSGTLDLMAHRLDQLSADTRRILAVGALIGDTFDLGQLRRVTEEESIQHALAEGLSQKLLHREEPTGTYTFVHDRIRESLVDRFEGRPRRKRELHASVATDFDEFYDTLDEEQIYHRAHHYIEAGDEADAKAVFDACYAAGREAADAEAWSKVYHLMQAAEDRHKPDHEDRALEFYKLQGKAAFETLRINEAREAYDRALAFTDDEFARADLTEQIFYSTLHTYHSDRGFEQVEEAFADLGHQLPSHRFNSVLLIVPFVLWNFLLGLLRVEIGLLPSGNEEPSSEREKKFAVLCKLCELRIDLAQIRRNQLGIIEGTAFKFRYGLKSNTTKFIGYGMSGYAAFWAMMGSPDKIDSVIDTACDYISRSKDRQMLVQTDVWARMIGYYLAKEYDDTVELIRNNRERYKWMRPIHAHFCDLFYELAQLERGFARDAAQTVIERLELYEENRSGEDLAVYCKHIGKAIGGLAMQGRFKEAGEYYKISQRLADSIPEGAADTIHWQRIEHDLSFLRQQGDYGTRMQEAIDQWDLDPDVARGWSQLYFISLAYVRADQVRRAGEANRADRLTDLEEALEKLEVAYNGPPYNDVMEAHYHAAKAAHDRFAGAEDEAMDSVSRAMELADEKNNPWAEFEAKRQKAHLHLDRKQMGPARREVWEAMELASRMHWNHWPNRLEEEFAGRGMDVRRGDRWKSSPTSSAYSRSRQAGSRKRRSVSSSRSRGSRGERSTADSRLAESRESTTTRLSSTSRGESNASSMGDVLVERQFRAMREMTLASRAVLDPEQQAETALRHAVELLGGERAFMYLADEESEQLEFFAGRGAQGDALDEPKDISSTILRRVQETGNPVRLSATRDGDIVDAESVVTHDLRSVLAVPLQAAESFLGILYIDNRMARGVFSDADLDVLNVISTQVAVAFETAQAAQLEIELAEVEKQLEVTNTVQSLFIPGEPELRTDRLEISTFYEPADESGGDWWWYDERSDGSILLFIGDITGHGIGPGMMTGTLMASLETANSMHEEGAELDGLIANLNRTFRELSNQAYHSTLCCLYLDPGNRRIDYWNAGATPVFALDPDGDVDTLLKRGSRLGLEQDRFQIGKTTRRLEPGTRLAAFTDGLTELEVDGKELGFRGLQDLLQRARNAPLDQATDQIISELKDLRGDRPRKDDWTLLQIDVHSGNP